MIGTCSTVLTRVTCTFIHVYRTKKTLLTIPREIQSTVHGPVWHRRPLYPGRHTQKNEFSWSRQVPPFWQGSDVHSSMLLLHSKPLHPATHEQKNEFSWSIHVPPFSQGADAH